MRRSITSEDRQFIFLQGITMANCLVTGGGGFIGSHLVDALLARGDRVRVLDDFSTGKRENLRGVSDRIELIEGSITNPARVREAVRDCRWIFHLAALPSVQQSVDDPVSVHDVCATGTLQLLDAVRRAGAERVVYVASSSAYGNLSDGLRTEDDPVAPTSPYGAAKLAGEHYCKCFTTVYGLETVRLRFFNIFGPRQDARSPYSGVIALFSAALSAGRTPTIHGDGLQSRDFVYVADAVQALIRAAEAPAAAAGNVYNIGTGVSTTVLDLVTHLNSILGTRIQPQHGPARAGDIRHSVADISRARRDLGYEPAVPFVEGLRLTLEGQKR
jgi:UDP-glucose 4-epimerase